MSSSTSSRFFDRAPPKPSSESKVCVSASSVTGFLRCVTAPELESRAATVRRRRSRAPECRPSRVSVLSSRSRLQPSVSGKPMSSVIASGRKCRARASPCAAESATMPLKPRSRARPNRIRAKTSVVFDDQQDAVGGFDALAIVVDLADASRSSALARGTGRTMRSCTPPVTATVRCTTVRADVALERVVERKRAAALRSSLSTTISPPSRPAISRLIARPRPVPPNLRDVPMSACWNASKITLNFSLRNADPGIGHREGDGRPGDVRRRRARGPA